MTALKNNIDHYMALKNIRMYTRLLADIARELGIKGQEANEFAEKEKANFSKMLNGKRPLKYEFIIPLEKIFGVSLARLMDEDAYKLPVDKKNVAFDKGFRYYASIDDPELYETEFDKILDTEGKTILKNSDEFGKTFLDYVVEYGAKNGVRYIYDNYKPRMRWSHNQFEFEKGKGITWLHMENAMPFVRLVANMDDAEMFYSIFDSYFMFFTNGHYGGSTCLFYNEEYLELIMDNELLFKGLFEIKEYRLELNKNEATYHSANPILNNCLKFALQHLPKYKKQAIEILKFGIKHNENIAKEHSISDCYLCNELGGIKDYRNNDYYGFVIVASENDSTDKEIKDLIKKMPKFKGTGEQ